MTKSPSTQESETLVTNVQSVGGIEQDAQEEQRAIHRQAREKRIRLKVDFRLCSIAGILCSLNLLDSGVISRYTSHLILSRGI